MRDVKKILSNDYDVLTSVKMAWHKNSHLLEEVWNKEDTISEKEDADSEEEDGDSEESENSQESDGEKTILER